MPKSNSEKDRPVISFKIDRNTLNSFDSVIDNVERTRALNNIIKYLIQPGNIGHVKAIITYDQ